MSDAAVDAAADGAAEAMETVATTTTTLATSALSTISTYVSAHVAATRDEAVRFCSDVTEKALASLEPDTSLYVQDVAQALKEVWQSLLLLIKALYAFLKLVGEPLLRKLIQRIAKQPTNVKAAEVALLLTIFVLWRVEAYPRGRKMLKRWHRAFVIRRVSFDAKRNKIKRAYRRALEGMSSKSRACMSVAPHFTFFAVILLVRHVNPTLSTSFWTSPYIVFVCLSLRLVNTDAALKKAAALDKVEDIVSANRRRYSEDPRAASARAAVTEQLKFWSIVGFLAGIRGGLRALPYAINLFEDDVAMVEELRGVFLVWLLYMGTDLAHSIIGRLLRSYTTPPVPQPSYRDQRDPWWVNEAIRRSLPGFIAKRIGDGSRIRAKTLEIWFDVDGWRALAVGTVTLITVGPVCRAGAACVGFVLPTIAAWRCGRAPPSRPCYRDLAAATDARARRYLAYGAVLGVREVLLLHDSVRQVYSYMPFRNHADIVVFLWLQLPVFQGAVALHARWTRRYMAIVEKFRDKD